MRPQFTILSWAMLLVVGLASGAEGAVSTWLSTVGAVGGGFTPGNPVVNFDLVLPPTGSLYLWLRNDARLYTAAYNINTTNPNVIKFMGVELYTPDLVSGGIDIDDRWTLPVSPGTIDSKRQKITNIAAASIFTAGLDPATRASDQLWDSNSNAALFAKINYTVTGFGSTNLVLSEGSTLIVDILGQPPLTFGTATINVVVSGGCPTTGLCVAGNGKSIADDDKTPSVLDNTDFGSIAQGSTQTRSFTMVNYFEQDMTIATPPTLTGPFELVGTFPTSLAPGASATFTVRLIPSDIGLKEGSISFPTNIPNFGQFSLGLSANVVPEPNSALLVALAGLTLLSTSRSRRRALGGRLSSSS